MGIQEKDGSRRGAKERRCLTARERYRARHALGLEYSRRSYRNRFFVSIGGSSHKDWLAMVDRGLAGYDGVRMFWLTKRGADLALNEGESLCPEDFPSLCASAPLREERDGSREGREGNKGAKEGEDFADFADFAPSRASREPKNGGRA